MAHAAYEGLSEIKETEEERTRAVLEDAYEIIWRVWKEIDKVIENKKLNKAHEDNEIQLLLSEAKPKLYLVCLL